MDVTLFEEDDKGNLVATAGDVTVTVGVHKDTVMIEQEGDNDEPDLIMMSNPEQVQAVIDRLQDFLNLPQ